MSNIDIGCRIYVGTWISDIGTRMSDMVTRMLDIGTWMSDMGTRMLDIRTCRYPDVGYSYPDVRYHIRCPISILDVVYDIVTPVSFCLKRCPMLQKRAQV